MAVVFATAIAIFCLSADFFKILGHRDDRSVKITSAEIFTIWVISAMYFGGNYKNTLDYCRDNKLFNFVPSRSRFSRRIYRLQYLFNCVLDIFKRIGCDLDKVEGYIIDTFPIPVCDNIRAKRSRLAPEKQYRGRIASKRRYFHGLKLHLLINDQKIIVEAQLTSGNVADVRGLDLMTLDIEEGKELYCDKGYTDYEMEDYLKEVESIKVRPIRRKNSKRFNGASQYLAIIGRKVIETVGSMIFSKCPKRIHATNLRGFHIKVFSFLMAHNFAITLNT